MGFLQWSTNNSEIFISLENVLNKSILSLNNIKTKQNVSKEDKKNYNFICSLINYYQSLKININEKYTYCIISSKTRNICAFHSLQKAQDIFVNWIKLLNNSKNNNFILDNSEVEINAIKKELINNIKQNKLLNVFKEKFNNYYNNKNNKTFIKLILSGLPDFLRPIIWIIILEKNNKFKRKLTMKEYLGQNNNPEILKQINKDLHRTFIINNNYNNSTIEKIDEEKINKLKNILIAISNYNPELGYTQGMNNIIGFLLRVTKFDEEKAFYLSILILDKIKGYFIKDFPLLKDNLTKFNNEFNIRYNKLYKHFKKNMMLDELWISKWLQTLFTINFPFNEVCRLWDSLIIFGFDFIIYLSLAIIYYAEDELLKLDDSSDFINYLKELMNPNPGIQIFVENNPNYSDNIIPIYNIISRAKKIKRETSIDNSNFKAYNINNRINYNINNIDLKENNTLNKERKSTFSKTANNSSENLLTKNIVNKSNLQQKNEDKSEKNMFEKASINEIKRNINFNDFNFNKKKENIRLRKYSDASEYSNNSNINNMIFNNFLISETSSNYFKGRNYSHSGIKNISLKNNNSNNYINGIPRRNKKIMVMRKSIHLNTQKDNLKNNRNYMSRSPDYFRLNSFYTNYNQIIGQNNINCGYTKNKVIENNNNDFIIYPQRVRGSFNIPLSNKFCYGYQFYPIQKK